MFRLAAVAAASEEFGSQALNGFDTMVVRIVIVGSVGAESVDYSDGVNTRAVKEDLLGGFGKGILKLNGTGVLSGTLEAGEYEYHVTQGKACLFFLLSFIF